MRSGGSAGVGSGKYAGLREDDCKVEHTKAAGHVRSVFSAGVGSGKYAGLS